MQRRQFALGLALAASGPAAFARRPGRKFALAAPSMTQPSPVAAVAPLLAEPAAGARLLQLQPMAATQPGETHSALAVSKASFGDAGAPYRFTGHARTVRQLRAVRPNAWEVAWLFWNFRDNDHLYYFVLKPNGWEIGKRDPRYVVPGVNDGQKIMATGDSVKATLGRWYAFDVRVNGAEADIYVDGRFVCHFRDTDSAPLVAGRVGLYDEDAVCQWHGITAPVADGFEAEPLQPFVDGSRLAHWTIAFLGYGAGGIVAA
jgi:hypothetical protein